MPEGPTSEPPGDRTDPAQAGEEGPPQGAPGGFPAEEPLVPQEISDLEHQDGSPPTDPDLDEDPDFDEELDLEEELHPGAAADLDEDSGLIGNAQDPADGSD